MYSSTRAAAAPPERSSAGMSTLASRRRVARSSSDRKRAPGAAAGRRASWASAVAGASATSEARDQARAATARKSLRVVMRHSPPASIGLQTPQGVPSAPSPYGSGSGQGILSAQHGKWLQACRGQKLASRAGCPLSLGGSSRVCSDAPGVIAKDRVAGGEHWRLQTPGGWVHVWRPAGYQRPTAGTVGLRPRLHRRRGRGLGAAPARQAVRGEPAERGLRGPRGPVIGRRRGPLAELEHVADHGRLAPGLPWPSGPLVVVGHSGAHVTVVPWLKNSPGGSGRPAGCPLWQRHGRGFARLASNRPRATDPGRHRRDRRGRGAARPWTGGRRAHGRRSPRAVRPSRSATGGPGWNTSARSTAISEMVTEGKAIAPS